MIIGENETRQQKKKEASDENQQIIDSYDYLSNAASVQDCTGLIPSAPLNREELESYDALYKYQPPEIPAAKNKK